MATLVLTTVGKVIGGPIGGAVGGLLGQAVDAKIFKPPNREGPRLTELALQTSSYGTQIPKLFGTMRVAGTVIWSTDLIEMRSKSRAGKGQPTTTTYSYAASFAVLLSARAIRDVRRIWADGNLLRGAAGDWKTATGFRLHPGGEDQPADPLIASAEQGMAPAHRGCAYAVFENMPLADYGNHIPSLTFEVVADDGAVTVGAIAAALADEIDGEAMAPVDGFAAAGGSTAAVLDTLATIGGGWWRPRGDRVALTDGVEAVAEVVDRGALTRSVKGEAAAAVSIAHYDAARDYQTGVQRARRPGGTGREERIELPAVVPAAYAKAIAEAMLLRGQAARVTRTVRAGLEALDISPGQVVAIAGSADRWRVVEARLEEMETRLTLTPISRAAAATAAASSGRVMAASDVQAGTTILHAVELPPMGDAPLTAPRLSIVANGTGAGWRRAALLYSLDDGASWIAGGSTAAPATLGTVEVPPDVGPVGLRDDVAGVTVKLARDDMALSDADATLLDAGANLALVGEELLQFARAEPLGQGRWRLTGLLRGRRGSEAAIGTQRAGDRFVLIEADSVAAIDLPTAALGSRVRVLATGVGDVEPVEAMTVVSGASVLPPSPVAVSARRASGMLTIEWTRRSRAGWRWIDGVDAPLGEERETYRVTLTSVGGDRVVDVDAPVLVLPDLDGPLTIAVRQRGTFGLSRAATLTI